MAIAGFTRVCTANKGGGMKLYLANAADVVSMTKGSGVESYSTITMTSGTYFYEYEFESSTLQVTSVVDSKSGAFTNQVIADLGKFTQSLRDEIQAIIDTNDCGFVIIVKDNNDVKHVFGYDEKDTTDHKIKMQLMGSNYDSKLAMNEGQANVLTFQSLQREGHRTYTDTVPVS